MISAALGISEKTNKPDPRPAGTTVRQSLSSAVTEKGSRTGGLDEVQIESIKTHYEKLNETAKRKETILNTIQEQGKLTAELQKAHRGRLGTIPYWRTSTSLQAQTENTCRSSPSKRTGTLATLLMLQRDPHPEERAANYVKGDVKNVEDALKGARDIIAEHVSEDERARNSVRNAFARQGTLTAKGGERQRRGSDQIPRLLRLLRIVEAMQLPPPARHPACRSGRPAESQHQLQTSEECVERLERQFVRSNNPYGQQSGGSRAGFLQTPIEAIHRDGICHAK